jgi:two-component system response regulator MprA
MSPARTTTTSVLVVEDDTNLCFALEQGLLLEGFDVTVATDAAEGLELAAELEPDVVLLDWMLPYGDGGPATCKRLCETVPKARVVMLTGLDDVRAGVRRRRLPAQGRGARGDRRDDPPRGADGPFRPLTALF